MDQFNEMAELRRNWRPPAGLGSSGPRPVRLSGGGIVVAIAAALLLLGAPAIIIFLGAKARNQAQERVLLRAEGREVDANVTRLWQTTGKNAEDLVSYEFVWDGNTYTGRSSAPRSAWNKLEPGGPLAVRFVPANPRLNHPRDWEKSVLPPWLPFVLAAMVAAFGAFMVIMLRRDVNLLSEGRAAPGVIRRYGGAPHGKKVIHYEFATLGGGVAKGKSGPKRRPPPIGSTVCIVYNSDNPRRSALYPMELVKLD